MKRKKRIFTITTLLLVSLIISAFAIALNVKTKVKELFKMNKTLQEEGYYMGDFEFRMVGFGYTLGKGEYFKTYKKLLAYHKKLKIKEGLIKIPKFKNNQEEINFYLDLQNPNTGAFIDESAPFCTYLEVTKNIINHLEALAGSTTESLKLKYPLYFLDQINTPEKLKTHLEDISYIGWIASKFPQTSFHFARNLLGEAGSENVFEKNNLYRFSPEWKHTMLKWMYDFQDSATGLWGPKSKRTKKLLKSDLNNTASILKSYADNSGNDIYKEFPLKYKDKLFKSALQLLSEPFPDKDDLDEIHEWNLRQSKGINMLLRHLWTGASKENKSIAEKIITRNIDICFEMYYVAEDGAFSYYPHAKHASCDGISNLILDKIGAFSCNKQKKIWGDPSENAKYMGEVIQNEVNLSDLDPVVNFPGINSIRIYTNKPDFKSLTDSVWALYYPENTLVLDIMELVPNIVHWAETTSLSMGNWTSIAEIKNEYSKLNIKKPLIYRDKIQLDELNRKFEKNAVLYVVGLDKLQIPGCIIKFSRSDK